MSFAVYPGPRPAFCLGLTGTFGCGKSAVSAIFTEQGVPVIDADELSRQATAPGQPALAEIAAEFGADVIAEDGTLRRRLLAERAFAGRAEITRLTRIIHPRVREAELALLAALHEEPLVVLDIPLLLEVGATELADRVAVVTVGEAGRFRRLKSRGYGEREVIARLGLQWPQSRKIALADYVIDNSGKLETTRDQILNLLEQLRGETKHA